PRQVGPPPRRPRRHAHHAERAPRGLPEGPPGGQSAAVRGGRHAGPGVARRDGCAGVAGDRPRAHGRGPRCLAARHGPRRPAGRGGRSLPEIGRASCRERVWGWGVVRLLKRERTLPVLWRLAVVLLDAVTRSRI